MKNYLSKLTEKLTPYVPGEQPKVKLIKLNTNENPYPTSQKATKAMRDTVDSVRLYSRPECEELREAIAKVEGLPSIDYVYPFNGSDEALAFCFGAFFDPENEIVFPNITYSFYPVYANLYAIDYREVPLMADLSIDVKSMISDGGVIFPNPNAPTGKALSIEDVEIILNNNPNCVVIVDEAYESFCGYNCSELIEKYDNLVIVRTMSKSHSFAGARVGFCMAQPHLIAGLIMMKNSFNSYTLDSVAQAGAIASILDVEYKNAMCEKVCKTRDEFVKRLQELDFSVVESSANFVFTKHNKVKGQDIFEKLKQQKILVRRFDNPVVIEDYLRITIGTDKQMDVVLRALQEILQ